MTSLPLPHLESTPMRDQLLGMCEWKTQRMEGVSHYGWHHGYWCPYLRAAMLLDGESDPNLHQVYTWRLDISRALKMNGSIPLSLNDHQMHYQARANQTAKIQAQVRRVCREAQVPRLRFVHVELHFQPKTRARRDPDNLVPTLKAAIDGLHHPEKLAEGKHVAYPWVPILPDDGPDWVSWSQPMIHEPGANREPKLWLVLRSPEILTDELVPEPTVQELPL